MKKMKMCLIIVQLLFMSITCCNALMADIIDNEKILKKPKIVFEEKIYDFGKIYMGEIVKHGFKFKNLGSDELIVTSVKSSCGCTAALVSKSNLLTGEEGEVQIKFNPGRFVGRVTKSVTVNSNDPKNSTYKLTITGEIIEEVRVSPKQINFGIIRKGDSCTRNIEIKTIPELKIEVKKVESPNPYITLTQNKTADNNVHSYQVSIEKYDFIGKFNGIVFFYTTSNRQERIDIPFSGEVVGDVTFYPEIVTFGSVKKNQDTERTVIVNFVNKDVKIEKIEADPGLVNYAVSDLNNSTKKIDIKLGKDIMAGKITSSLRIYTNSAIQPVITIPINGEVRG
ncbi:MAG: DUF1573 domain-containing protein [Candidatus Brocadia sp.]|nr:DUF1573 domain-containing protein [Candidatus Brocadia sp.]